MIVRTLASIFPRRSASSLIFSSLMQSTVVHSSVDVSGVALRIQRVVLRKAFFKLAPHFGSVFLHTASFEPDW